MTEHETPRYRYRGNVKPSAEVSRPVAAYRNAAGSAAADSAASSATIDIFDVIDSWGGWWGISAAEVDAAIKEIGDVDTLYVRLNSPGGEATEGVAIANLLRANKATVRVTVYGLAASAASMVAVGGDVVNMAPGSILMIHDALNIIYGNADEMRQCADVLDTISDSYAGVYATKAGGTTAQWRAVMREDKWYSAEQAVEAKLADRVGLDPTMPDSLPPVEDDADDDATVIELDITVNPAARAAARRFDLSMLPNAPAALAPKTPAEPPVVPSTEPKEADAMSDTLIQGLRERFDLADDADEATVLAKADELLEQATKPDDGATTVDPKAAAAALEADGKVVVSKNVLDELRAMAEDGAKARANQIAEERDEAIAAAVSAGKISRERIDAWKASWDKDAEGTKSDLDTLPARFPVAKAPGVPGGDGDSTAPFSDEEASALAARAGISKEGLLA